MSRKYKLVIFVPDQSVELLKSALFSAGAGRLGDYDQCSWQTRGTGQFRPLSVSDPFVGELNQLEQHDEWRLETLVEESCIKEVLQALRESHPYEEPAFDLVRLEDPDLGRVLITE